MKTPIATFRDWTCVASHDNLAGAPVEVVEVHLDTTTEERDIPDAYSHLLNFDAKHSAHCHTAIGDTATNSGQPDDYRYVPLPNAMHAILTSPEAANAWAIDHATNCAAAQETAA